MWTELVMECINNRKFGKPTILSGILFCLLNSFHITIAQQIQSSPHAVEMGGGTTLVGSSFYGAYVRYIKDESTKIAHGHLPCPGHKEIIKLFPNRMYGKAVIFYESGSKNGIGYKSTGVDLDFYYTLVKIGKSVFINLKAGAIVSTDKISARENNNSQLASNQLNYGLLGGAELEWFIMPKFTFVAGADQRFLFNNNAPLNNRAFVYAGIRFNFVKKIERMF